MKRTSVWVSATALAMALLVVLAGCTPAGPQQAGGTKPVNLDFVVWSYGIETVQDNIKNFEAKNQNIKVSLQDFSWLDYHDTIVSRATANTPTDGPI